MRIYLNDDWSFTREYFEGFETANDTADLGKKAGESIERVRLPHNVRDLEYNYCDDRDYQTVSGYARTIEADSEWEGRKVILNFEAVGHEATVYLNGEQLVTHRNGYTAFPVDLTDKLVYGKKNYLAVRVDSRESVDQPPFGGVIDYLTYGGIYREVYLDICEKTRIEDVFVRTLDMDSAEKTIHVDLKVSSECFEEKGKPEAEFILERFDAGADEKAAEPEGGVKLGTAKVEKQESSFSLTAKNVALWDIDDPVLYILTVRLKLNDITVDTKKIRFGFREVEITDKGFFLNGRRIKLRGLNRHQSYPYAGYAMPKNMQRLDADILKKELGVNAVRTSHYPQSHHFIDRCDELGLLVFTEIPGWQHIGGESWKDIAVENVSEMIRQYRNHPSIFLWGVRINESQDDHDFYVRTNKTARELDPSRPIGGVRYIKKSELLEDVYTFNDFIHDGISPATSKKRHVTPDMSKGYLISEYNGHMYPTKAFDDEPHRTEHALRHARVLDSVAGSDEIAGSFGWCMFDYNTHRDFGSGDRICYHGVTDMFRNPKEAAYVYRMQSEGDTVLEVSSSMDIGDYPGGLFKNIYIYSNADLVKVYKNDVQIALYCTSADMREKLEKSGEYREISNYSSFRNLAHGPVYMNDFIGDRLIRDEGYKPGVSKAVKKLLMDALENGMDHLSLSAKLTAARLMLFHRFKIADGIRLYTKYVSGWGETSNVYRFEAIKDGNVIKTVTKGATNKPHLKVTADHTELVEDTSYDAALVRITAVDDYDNVLPYCQDPVTIEAVGEIEIVGPSLTSLKGGMTGTIVRTKGKAGSGELRIADNRGNYVTLSFEVKA